MEGGGLRLPRCWSRRRPRPRRSCDKKEQRSRESRETQSRPAPRPGLVDSATDQGGRRELRGLEARRDEPPRQKRNIQGPQKTPPPYCSASAIGLGPRACRCRRRPRRSHPHCHSLSLRAGRPSSSEGRFLSWDPSPGRPGQCSCRGGSRPRGPRRSAKDARVFRSPLSALRCSVALLPRPPKELRFAPVQGPVATRPRSKTPRTRSQKRAEARRHSESTLGVPRRGGGGPREAAGRSRGSLPRKERKLRKILLWLRSVRGGADDLGHHVRVGATWKSGFGVLRARLDLYAADPCHLRHWSRPGSGTDTWAAASPPTAEGGAALRAPGTSPCPRLKIVFVNLTVGQVKSPRTPGLAAIFELP